MNQLKNIIILLFCVLFFQSCYKELVLDLSKEENKIVINALFNNTEPLSATVTKSFIFYEDVEIEELVDAEIAIYENGVFKENMVYQKTPDMDIGEFTASFIPKIEATYRIEATATGMTPAMATGAMPRTGVDLADIKVQHGGDNAYAFSFTLNDPAEKNYYYLKMFFQGYEIDSLTQERIDRGPFVVEIPEAALPNPQRYLRNGFIFKDDGVNNQALTISGIAKSGRPQFSAANFPGESKDHLKNVILDTDTLYIHLQTLSEAAYKFYSSNASPIQDDSDFLTESNTVYGNVENGLGLFSGIYISEVGANVEQ